MSTQWIKKSSDQSEDLTPPREMPSLVWEILKSHNLVDVADIDDFFTSPLKNLTSPFKIIGMDTAVLRILTALELGQKICIYADFDMDGTPGLALFYRGLISLGFEPAKISYYQPSRLLEGFGLHKAALEKIKKDDVDLVVTIDLGITAVDEAKYAKEIGLELIITDHHLQVEELPEAVAVLNPNRKACTSNLSYLCGTGVAFYFILAIRSRLKESSEQAKKFNVRELLDCFCIGTISDMVPLIKDNRVLVKHGMVELGRTKSHGLKALMIKLGLWGKELGSQDISMRLAPKLNALSRLESGIRPIEIFLAESEEKAYALVEQVLAVNERRRSLQKEAESLADDSFQEREKKHFVWEWSAKFHKGVIGLVATKLMQKYDCPAFVGAEIDGKIIVSSRCPKDLEVNLTEVFQAATSMLVKHGGHAKAAGCELLIENVESFRRFLSEYLSDKVVIGKSVKSFEYCAEGPIEEINREFMGWYQRLNPFGIEFETPLIKISNVSVKGTKTLKGGHLKIMCYSLKPDSALEALWFSPPNDHTVGVAHLCEGHRIDILAEPQWNEFAGQKRLQLLVKDLNWSAPIQN